jgi:hypothetical protein
MRIPAMVVLSWLVLGVGARADITLNTPAGLHPGDQFRIVFVTDGTTNARSPGIGTYDQVVNNDVSNAGGVFYNGQSVTNWLAIGSTSAVNAIDHIGSNANTPVYDVADNLVSQSTTSSTGGLWSGSLQAPIQLDLSGTRINAVVWTGTRADGTTRNFQALGFGDLAITGVTTGTDSSWTNASIDNLNNSHVLYGISPILTVPASSTVVPEPSTAIVSALGAVAFLAYGWSRHRRAQQRQAAA